MQNIDLVQGKKFLILGLARSGHSTADFILKNGGSIVVWDDNREKREEAQEKGYPLLNLEHEKWSEIHFVCLSPGLPYDYPEPHPVLIQAKKWGCKIINDIILMGMVYPHNTFVGITGTNGKSTTTALIGHILQELGFEVAVGGNIGKACLTLPPLGEKGIYVLEVSSFQLDIITHSPFQIAILLNLSPDHLDRHGNMENYINAKKKIFNRENQSRIVGFDDQYCQNLCRQIVCHSAGHSSLTRISGQQNLDVGIFVHNKNLTINLSDSPEIVCGSVENLRELKGTHNHQNIAAAIATIEKIHKRFDIPFPESHKIMQALHSFKALPHRQQLVADWKNVTFINDSKATNWDSAQNSLQAFDNILWIAGGRPKEADFPFEKKILKNVVRAYLIGEAAKLMSQKLTGIKDYELSETMSNALKAALIFAEKNKNQHFHILLAPACTSFDQFKDYEDRGKKFEELTKEIIQ